MEFVRCPEWSATACDQFEDLTHCAMWKVVEYKPSGAPRVEQIATNHAGEHRNIGHELVKQGLAGWEEGDDVVVDTVTVTRDN